MVFSTLDEFERESWRGKAQAYADSSAGLCSYTADAMLDAAGVRPGVRLLDVGTGIGTLAANAAMRGATVTAIDAQPDMVAWTAQRVPGATVELATLPNLPYADGTFDAVVANFVINHVGDPAAALAEVRRVTREGGKVAVSIWPGALNKQQMLWHDCFEAAGAVRPPIPRLAGDRDFRRTTEGVEELVRGSGLTGVTAWSLDWVHRADPDLWWSGPAAGLATAGAVLTAQTPEVIARIREEYDKRVGDQVELPVTAILAVGTK
jgi:SAM-dependent methyltransferase